MAVQISGNDITVPRDTTVTRNLTVGGVLTYEDVTNVDSVGLVTARSGIEIGARPGVAASISVDGNAIFSGITTVGSHMAVGGVTPETFGGGYVTLEVAGSTNDNGGVFKSATSGSAGSGSSGIEMLMNTDPVGGSINVVTTHPLKFSTANTERARLDTGGHLLIGTTTEGHADADDLTIATSGNTGITIRSGTTSNGGIYFSDATSGNAEFDGFIVYNQNDRELRFGTQQSTRMRVDAGGRLLIGGSSALEISGHTPRFQMQGTDHNTQTLSIVSNSGDANPAYLFLSKQRSGSVGGSTIVQNGDRIGEIRFNGHDGNDFAHETAIIASEVDGTPGTNDMPGRLQFYTTADGAGAVSERMRITSGGQVLIGATSNNTVNARLAIVTDGVPAFYANPSALSITSSNSADANAVEIFQGRYNKQCMTLSHNYNQSMTFAVLEQADVVVGSITGNGSNASFNTSSDYRLKENIVNITDGITRLKQLTPRRFNWIADSTNTLEDGFIAHEVSPIIPEAVTGEKDAQEEDGSIDPQQMDYSKLTPLLTAALQEAIAKIEVLETEVAALKSS